MDILFTLVACVLLIVGFVVICRPMADDQEEDDENESSS